MEKEQKHYTIKDWPEYERPRERLLQHGPQFLTDAELLALIINKGHSGKLHWKWLEIYWPNSAASGI